MEKKFMRKLGIGIAVFALVIAWFTGYVVIDNFINLRDSGATFRDILVGNVPQATLEKITIRDGSDLNFANFVLWVGTVSAIFFGITSKILISKSKTSN